MSFSNTRFQTRTSRPASDNGHPTFLPSGAIRLDHQGRILHPSLSDGGSGGTSAQCSATDFFLRNCSAALLEHLERIFQQGQLEGFLYQFVDVTLQRAECPLEMTLLLYYHSSTQEAWIFIEPKQPAPASAQAPLRSAA